MKANENDLKPCALPGSLRRMVRWCRSIWKDMTGDDPMPRLQIAFMWASVIGAIGVCGVLFGLLGALLMIGSPPQDTVTWSKIGDVIGKSLWRITISYGAAAVIHAVAKLYEKQNPPNDELGDKVKSECSPASSPCS